jgi:hypothetical protein
LLEVKDKLALLIKKFPPDKKRKVQEITSVSKGNRGNKKLLNATRIFDRHGLKTSHSPQTGTLMVVAVTLGLRKGPQYLLLTVLATWLHVELEPFRKKVEVAFFRKRPDDSYYANHRDV